MNDMQNFLQFDNVSFSYPPVAGDLDKDGKQILPKPIFEYFTATLPGGFVHLVGPNASGKTTLILLAAGRLKPSSGTIKLFGVNPFTLDENKRNSLSSFIYQNMEFETDECVQSLFEQVSTSSIKNMAYSTDKSQENHPKSLPSITELVKLFELKTVLDRKLSALSKGELQRVLITFSLLYKSSSIFMDEPLFAMETKHKELVLEYLKNYSALNSIPIYISMHDIELTKKYAENVLLIYPSRDMDFGTPEEVLLPESLEKAYGVPVAMLRESEELNRKNMQEAAEVNQQVINSLEQKKQE